MQPPERGRPRLRAVLIALALIVALALIASVVLTHGFGGLLASLWVTCVDVIARMFAALFSAA